MNRRLGKRRKRNILKKGKQENDQEVWEKEKEEETFAGEAEKTLKKE